MEIEEIRLFDLEQRAGSWTAEEQREIARKLGEMRARIDDLEAEVMDWEDRADDDDDD